MNRPRRRISRWIAVAVVVAVLGDALMVYAIYLPQVARFMSERAFTVVDRVPLSDAAVVFFGALNGSGSLDENTEFRVTDAARLYTHGRIHAIIAVGGARPDRAQTGAAIMARRLSEKGVPADKIDRDSTSYDSFSNWAQVERIAMARGFHSLVLVSDPGHLMRLAELTGDPPFAVTYYSNRDRPASPARRWAMANHELLAWTALRFLPRSWYVSILRRARAT